MIINIKIMFYLMQLYGDEVPTMVVKPVNYIPKVLTVNDILANAIKNPLIVGGKEVYLNPKGNEDPEKIGSFLFENLLKLAQSLNTAVDLALDSSSKVRIFDASNYNELDYTNADWLSSQDTDITNTGVYAWDPRLLRLDAFLMDEENTGAPILVPFASNTVASAFFDESFVVERVVAEEMKKQDDAKGSTNTDNTAAKSTSTEDGPKNNKPADAATSNGHESDKVLNVDKTNKELLSDPELYGVHSLINPYTLTKLSGGLTTGAKDAASFHNRMYDIRNRKRFYDVAVNSDSNYHDINNPTTTNIIHWSNNDIWGRTPYSFLDFVFCKYWNVIPNNRLITLRKYHAPTYDNLKFENMFDNDKNSSATPIFSPIATVVTYFGDDTGNSISNLLSFSTGTNWKEIQSEIHNVTGDSGSDPRAVIDNMFTNGSRFAGVTGENSFINSILSSGGFWSGKYLSYGKFSGLLQPGGYLINKDLKFYDQMTVGMRDPSDQLYSNRIQGPVNRVDRTLKREAGITFEQTLLITCEYIARPIGGVNTKAAMIDILSNCLEMASVNAMWWGGGYKFMIKPHLYPFKRTDKSNSFMMDLYNGRIFGSDGALAHLVDGVKKFGSTDANGNNTGTFEWSNVTSKMGEFLGLTLGALGSLLTSISSTLFGSNSTLSQWLLKGTDAISSEEQQAKGQAKMNALFSNVNDMWRSLVVQLSIMPYVENMKALLSGEPVGNWHLTVGNPLNPIMVIGNLVCDNMKVEFSEELGPDDFPMEMKVTYTLKHGMPRDKQSIESMFNRGSGRTYVLPDFMRASSDYETKVDKYTGVRVDLNGEVSGQYKDGYYIPAYSNSAGYLKEGANLEGISKTGGNFNVLFAKPKPPENSGNPDTTFIAKFTPLGPNNITSNVVFSKDLKSFLNESGTRSIIKAHGATRKLSD